MCLAGDGGGKGLLKSRSGVEGVEEGELAYRGRGLPAQCRGDGWRNAAAFALMGDAPPAPPPPE